MIVTDEVLEQYLSTALWSSVECDEDGNGTAFDNNYDTDDIATECVDAARAELNDFVEQASELLDGLDTTQVAHDFWLTRNGHGAGFWDRGLGDVGNKLTELCKAYGSCDLYVGDDGKVYIS